jgi:hypothetical protein
MLTRSVLGNDDQADSWDDAQAAFLTRFLSSSCGTIKLSANIIVGKHLHLTVLRLYLQEIVSFSLTKL